MKGQERTERKPRQTRAPVVNAVKIRVIRSNNEGRNSQNRNNLPSKQSLHENRNNQEAPVELWRSYTKWR